MALGVASAMVVGRQAAQTQVAAQSHAHAPHTLAQLPVSEPKTKRLTRHEQPGADRERDRDREKDKERRSQPAAKERLLPAGLAGALGVGVSRDKERERERERETEREREKEKDHSSKTKGLKKRSEPIQLPAPVY